MNKSENINELATALSRAQGSFKNPPKDKTATVPMKSGGKYTYQYADLATMIDTVRDPLSKNGLAVNQLITSDNERDYVETVLMHTSGQWMSSRYPLGTYDRPQDLGSAITYLRRYCLSAILGIASDEDDDAEDVEMTKKTADARTVVRPQPAGKTVKITTPNVFKAAMAETVTNQATAQTTVQTTWAPGPAEQAEILAIIGQPGSTLKSADVKAMINTEFKKQTLAELNIDEYKTLVGVIRKTVQPSEWDKA